MTTRGRPRDRGLDDRIAAATASLLEAVGYEQLTMEAVAAEAGVSKPALYRRFANKTTLVFSLMASRGEEMAVPDTGSVTGDLREGLRSFVDFLRTVDRPTVADGFRQMVNDPVFATAVQRDVFDVDRDRMLAVVERAVDRGEVGAGVDGRALLDDLAGVLVYRILLRHEDLTDEDVERLVGWAIDGARPGPPRTRSRPVRSGVRTNPGEP